MKPPDFTLRENLRGHQLTFKTTPGLFSYKKVDAGTKLLIDSVQFKDGDNILDLGCGYGPIGIALAKSNPGGKVYLVDRDFVAIEYARKNCQLNDVTNCEVLLSNGFGHLEDINFDIIAANLPSHFSNDMLKWMLEDAKNHLKNDGKLYVVTVSKLRKFIKREFENIFGNWEKVDHNAAYTVSLAMK